jgi:hypothetical protein
VNNPLFLVNQLIITSGDMTTTLTSSTVDIREIPGVAVQGYWSGTSPVGTLTLNGSNDGVVWTAMSSLSVSGNNGSDMFNYVQPNMAYIQIVYTPTSGSGSLNVRVNCKGSN